MSEHDAFEVRLSKCLTIVGHVTKYGNVTEKLSNGIFSINVWVSNTISYIQNLSEKKCRIFFLITFSLRPFSSENVKIPEHNFLQDNFSKLTSWLRIRFEIF